MRPCTICGTTRELSAFEISCYCCGGIELTWACNDHFEAAFFARWDSIDFFLPGEAALLRAGD
jgi:hypothetical protein